jgi:division protein CdvB (Snf7/Vps24/ESCRT-III family)
VALALLVGSFVAIIFITQQTKVRVKEAELAASGGGELKRTIEANIAINQKLIERLDQIDSRLGAMEKTLNDIP